MTTFSSFSQLADFRSELAEQRGDIAENYDRAFVEHTELAKLTSVDEPAPNEMPDPDMVCRAVEMAIGTIFDVLRDTTMEEFAQQLAWGMVNSFHMTARLAEKREDDAAMKVKELTSITDPSEIHAVEVEEATILCQTLQGCREALEAMRDHASEVYRVETGKVFQATRGSQVSRSTVTASQVEARDYLQARAATRRAQYQPEGPMVVVSGGQEGWHDHAMFTAMLDNVKERIPNMVLATTGMRKGVDAIAGAWAKANEVNVILFTPERAHGKRAPFLRNEKLVQLKPVEAIIAEGSGIQANLAQRLREAGVPLHIRRLSDQAADAYRQRD